MWPASLQMSREECRAVLRRLELETYSHVISVFRAQGGLNEDKAKILAELRALFHISQDRHRAEARRVSNDEELSTIAEVISGPNTWQEWAREGRRQFPMLPRVAPQTALAFLANKVADETAKENAKLPYPADTANAQREYDMEIQAHVAAINNHKSRHTPNVVVEDPFKMPDIPAISKKNLKRNTLEHQLVSGNVNKRFKNESLQYGIHNNNNNNNNNKNLEIQQQVHINNNNMDGNPNKLTTLEQKQLEGRRFFYTQQLKNKNKINVMSKKQQQNIKSAITKNKKVQKLTKSQQKQELLKQKQIEKWEELQQQQQQQAQQSLQVQNIQINNNNVINMNEISQQQLQPLHVHMNEQQQQQPQQNLILSPVKQQPVQLSQQQISLAKKDLAKHFTKLSSPNKNSSNNNNNNQNNNNNLILSNSLIAGRQLLSPTTTTTANTTSEINSSAATSPTPKIVEQKQLLSTPVQKYIVEDRLPPTVTQVVNLPVSPQTSNKLRAINTTILPPGTKLQPAIAKKILPLTAVSTVLNEAQTPTKQTQQQQQQLYNIISNSESSTNLTLPTHAPPAIINLHGVSSSNVSQLSEVLTVSSVSVVPNSVTTTTTYAFPTQGKVLTTKLMPVVFNNATKATTSNIATSGTTTLIQTGGSATVASNAAFIKNLPQVLLSNAGAKTVSVSGANAGNTYISTLSSGTQLFRKPNIISRKGPTTTTTQASNKPTIISNIKLCSQKPIPLLQLPVTSSTGNSSSSIGLSSSYRMASTNGKVIINSVQKLNSPFATSLINPRVPLQKVQIIPASSGSIPLQHAQTAQNKNANTNNMLFMQNKMQNMKTNLVVLGSNALPVTSYKLTTTNANIVDTNANMNNKNNKIVTITGNNQLMAEDGPLDILNMPIIVENSESLINDNTSNTAMTFTNLLPQQTPQDQPQQGTGLILGATDWEMELDQAAAAGRFTRRAYSVCSSGPQRNLNQPFMLPRHLGRSVNSQFDKNSSGVLSGLQNIGLSRQVSNPTGGSHIVMDDVITLNKPEATATNDNKNEQLVVLDEQQVQETKEITTSAGTINVSEGGCIPMELETDAIKTTTIIPASSDATFHPTSSTQPTTITTTLSNFLKDELQETTTTTYNDDDILQNEATESVSNEKSVPDVDVDDTQSAATADTVEIEN